MPALIGKCPVCGGWCGGVMAVYRNSMNTLDGKPAQRSVIFLHDNPKMIVLCVWDALQRGEPPCPTGESSNG